MASNTLVDKEVSPAELAERPHPTSLTMMMKGCPRTSWKGSTTGQCWKSPKKLYEELEDAHSGGRSKFPPGRLDGDPDKGEE